MTVGVSPETHLPQWTPAARAAAYAWDLDVDNAAGNQCRAYGAAAIMRLPTRIRISWADDNTLKDEITLVDPKAYTHPWTVTKIYKRAPAGFTLLPYVCLENNRNPVDAEGHIGFVHSEASAKP